MFLKFNRNNKLPNILSQFEQKSVDLKGFSFQLRRAHIADIDMLVNIEEAVYAGTAPWLLRDFLSELSRPNVRLYLVVERNEQVIGFAGVAYQRDQRDMHITNIAIVPVWQNKGLGTLIINELLDFSSQLGVDTMSLEARASNRSAIVLYTRLGFQQSGIKKGYYIGDHEDAVSMVNNLDSKTRNS
ncbi:ribosomal protein S18-alanine N-acetyltransferase [uncultured Leuconostoc sp.]|uniref:ribosomal protein S18-alanine N-acetyltransferase n=1 Tax=uncultured Leuconostoc sp. TaxID=173262 RepID=UPI0025F5AFD2|nr:ribosomal protein S18-alanine N-acetyltransferase [uncultured Leuconostoc sp.]